MHPKTLHPAVSVIIPVYNTAPYLRRCLDSVCGQTLRDIEIICVNDGSMDDSLEILHEYAAKDTRVQIIDFAENRGASAARNTGIDVAQGEYIGFVDSDDLLALDFYEKLYTAAKETKIDIVKGTLIRTEVDGTSRIPLLNDKVRENKFNFNFLYQPCIYSRILILNNGIKFPCEITNREDAVFLICAVYFSNNIGTVDDAIYYNMRRDNSLDSDILSIDQIKSSIAAIFLIIEFINNINLCKYDYMLLFLAQLKGIIGIAPRGESYLSKSCCAEAAVQIYHKCKYPEALNKKLQEEYLDWYYLFTSGDLNALTDYLLGLTTQQQILFSHLRAKLRRS